MAGGSLDIWSRRTSPKAPIPGGRLPELARLEPTVGPNDSAKRGEELALSTPARRVPVVDGDGRLLGIVAVTTDLEGFCGTGGSGGG